MENEKSHDQPSANWRFREAGGVVPVQTTRRPEGHRSQWCESQPKSKGTNVQEQEQMEVPAQAEGAEFALPSPFLF